MNVIFFVENIIKRHICIDFVDPTVDLSVFVVYLEFSGDKVFNLIDELISLFDGSLAGRCDHIGELIVSSFEFVFP
jgi:hypothetical protein